MLVNFLLHMDLNHTLISSTLYLESKANMFFSLLFNSISQFSV